MKRVYAFAFTFAVLAVTLFQTWNPHAAAAPAAVFTVNSTLDEPLPPATGQCLKYAE